MKRRKNILKVTVILLITAAMFLSTVAATVNTIEKHFSETCVTADIVEEKNSFMNTPGIYNIDNQRGPLLFYQHPYRPYENWNFYSSSTNLDQLCQDDFWNLSAPIYDIHWWGISLYWSGSEWYPCNPEGMEFEIIFYKDVEGTPGEPVCTYSNIEYERKYHDTYNSWEAYQWSADFDPYCDLSEGWVSIQSTYSPNDCSFLWCGSSEGNFNALRNSEEIYDNLSFGLTGEECEPSIDVEKYVWDPEDSEWDDADTLNDALDLPICTDAKFKIIIHNNGECCELYNIKVNDNMHDSLKYISADPEPDEYYYEPPIQNMKWDFSGPLNPCQTIEIIITAHVEGPECSTDYNHVEVSGHSDCDPSIVNDDDWAYVHAVKKARSVNRPFQLFLQNHLYLFPILLKILLLQ